MIEQQIRPWDVLDLHVLDVIESVPRELFVPEKHRELAFADLEIPLEHGQVMMSPKVEARMLQALEITPTDQVLEVGSGSGFVTACLANMAQQITSSEYYPDLSDCARQHCEISKLSNIEFLTGDIFDQLDSLELFDVIAVTASSPVYFPEFANHLRPNGRLFIIVGERPVMSATLMTRVTENEYHEQVIFETEIPALIGVSKEKAFSF